VYWVDSGLTCHLLGIQTEAELERSPFLGAVYEGYVATEIVKSQINAGRRREIYYFRDHQGLKVDFLVPHLGNQSGSKQDAGITMIEAKATKTPTPDMTRPMQQLARVWGKGAMPLAQSYLIHRAAKVPVNSTAIAPQIQALSFDQFVQIANG
jgi:uncharacterized protein